MKIIRWLLSHSLFILLIVAVIYAYMFWGNLLGKDTPAGKALAYLSSEFVEVKEFVNAIKAKQAQLSEEQLSAQHSSRPEMGQTANTDNTEKAPQLVESIEPEPVATEEVVVEPSTEVAGNPVESQPVVEQQQLESIEPEPAAAEPVAAEPVSAEPVSAEPVSAEPVAAEPVATEEVVVEPSTEVASEPVAPQPVIEQQAVNISDSQINKPVIQNSAAIIDSKEQLKQVKSPVLAASQESTPTVNKTPSALADADKNTAMAVIHSDTEEKFVPAEVAKQLDNVDEHGEVIDASQPGGAVRENWITARKSYYQHNYELSEKSYQQVIESTKNNFDAYGELGNVYFNQGKNKQAASAYFEAAAILVSKGQVSRARSLIGLLRHLDKSKAIELQQLIDSTRS